jgi:hypothetical protein
MCIETSMYVVWLALALVAFGLWASLSARPERPARPEQFVNTTDDEPVTPDGAVELDNVLMPVECQRLTEFFAGQQASQLLVQFSDHEVGDIARKLRSKACSLVGVRDRGAYEKLRVMTATDLHPHAAHFFSITSGDTRSAVLVVNLTTGNAVFLHVLDASSLTQLPPFADAPVAVMWIRLA